MKIWLRWLKLVFTCGLGRHANPVHRSLPGNTLYTECPRCHDAYMSRYHEPLSAIVHLHPPYWDVARGKYDRSIE